MLRLDASVREAGGRLVLVKGPRRVHRVFELTRAVTSSRSSTIRRRSTGAQAEPAEPASIAT